MILAGDVGGTKTNLGVFDVDGKIPRPVLVDTFLSQEFDNLESLVDAFCAKHSVSFQTACLSVAGPVIENQCQATNLPWLIDAQIMSHRLGVDKVWLINDLEANAHGITHLSEDEFVTLSPGAPGIRGNACVVSAGTGLGEAGMFWSGEGYIPFACEGGHADFAPRNDEEIELLKYLRRDFQHQHVSYERILSGIGLYNIYSFLRDTGRYDEPDWLVKEMMAVDDPAATISRFALEKNSDICVRALDIFVDIYGAEAGNAALKFMAFGGVFIGGGIAPKIIEKLKDNTFLDSFLRKGRMKGLLERMPVKVIMNNRTALIGAARCAMLKSGRLIMI